MSPIDPYDLGKLLGGLKESVDQLRDEMAELRRILASHAEGCAAQKSAILNEVDARIASERRRLIAATVVVACLAVLATTWPRVLAIVKPALLILAA